MMQKVHSAKHANNPTLVSVFLDAKIISSYDLQANNAVYLVPHLTRTMVYGKIEIDKMFMLLSMVRPT